MGGNPENEQVRQAAMRILRDARRRIEAGNPGLLARMNSFSAKIGKREEIRERIEHAAPEAVDRHKNVETALKFLSLKPGGDFMHKSVGALLDKHRH